MGRRGGGGGKRVLNTSFVSTNNISLRELTGKKQTKGGSSINAKAALKLDHLQRLVVWTGAEASVPSLGALFGRTLAAAQEAIVVPPEPSLFPCQRCETVLQPGFNCTVRIEKNRAKARRRSEERAKEPDDWERMQLDCISCGHSWYAARDAVSMLTIDAPSSNKNVGTAPLATAKFQGVEKKLASPRESDKATKDTVRKTTEAYLPVLEAQRSFSKSKKEENSESAKKPE